MNIRTIATCCQLARTNPIGAVTELLNNPGGVDAARKLMQAALWKDKDILAFEKRGKSYRIQGVWGDFWFTPLQYTGALQPPAPTIHPRDARTLAQSIVDMVANRYQQHTKTVRSQA